MYLARSTRLISTISRLSTLISLVLVVVATMLAVTCSHAAVSPAHAGTGRTVRAGIYNFKPMVYSDSDGSAQGFFVTVLNTIAQKENWNVQYVPGTWQEGLDRLKSDQIDLLLCTGYTDARDKYLDFPNEFLLLDWGTVYKAKGSSINNIFDLEGKTVSVLKGSVLPAGFQELTKQFHIHVTIKEMSQASEVLASVVSGSADAGVAANLSGILNKAWQKVERTPIIFTPSKLGFAVNEGKNGDLISVLDREISALKADKSSVYYHELEHLLGNKEQEIPKDAYWVLCGVVAALLLAISWTIILKRQVRAKTEHLEAEIVERKRTEEIRSNEKAFLRSLIDSADDLIYFKDSNGIYIGCNKASEKFIGFSEAEQIGKSDFDLIDHELAEQTQKHDKMVMESNTAVRFEEWVTRSDGSRVLLDTIKAPIVTPDRQVLGLVGFSRDITDRKQIEKALQDSEKKYRQLFSNLPTGFALHEIILDSEGKPCDYRFLEINPVFEQLTGLKAAELIGKTQLEVMPNSEPYWVEIYGQVVLTGNPVSFENFSVELGKHYQVNAYSPEPGKFATVFNDITERKHAEQELLESKALFEAVVDNVPLMIFLKEATDLRFVIFNRAGEELVGYDRETFIGKNNLDLFPPEEAANFMAKDRETLSIESGVVDIPEEPISTAKKGLRFLHTRKVCIRGADGVSKYLLGISEDITDRKRAEEEKYVFEQQLQHTQKLESLGVLSGGIAHDFNNILAIIMGYCSLTKIDYETAEQNIPEIEKAAERAAGLCRQMLAYAGKAQLSLTQVNMWMLVDEMVNMLKATLPQNAVINADLSTDTPFISADASQIRQIVMNLIINASEAIGKEQGEIHVSLATATVITGQAEKDYHGKEIPPDNYVCLEVTDTGCGMDAETKWRIFEPFYTTKFAGRGLGMSAVLGIINSHNGALQIFSQVGRGTTFKVYLPAQKSNSTGEEDQKHTASVPWQGSGTILLVEDEDHIRYIANELLTLFGFTVLEAVNGKEALELFQQNAADITLVLTDMGMPVMDGYALLPALKQLNPKLPIIVSSGFGDDDITSRIGTDNIAGIISKPYNHSQLREMLRSVVG